MKNRVLKKSKNKVIAGICAGIAEYFGWQPSQVRLMFVIAIILGASGVLAYVILFFLMPNSDSNDSSPFNIKDFEK
ncbi:phage shock protein C (PspC) family protein [Marivirga sericea]|uniref:Phage shock protein C (PspC) family protein n=1 Tax=Marivirga sericea TaxID=1028 RepID=A0A1X7L4E2_9BACT|nr:PspC domain-containing protein [Marivirga sericea]SMG48497.1 phage shock protein C (PspC) family protein [Marivirga sericea]